MNAVSPIAQGAPDDAIREVLSACVKERQPLSLVDSPPGAGKTQLIEQVVSLSVVHAADRVYCVTPGADQAASLARRLLDGYNLPRLELLWSKGRAVPADIASRALVTDDPTSLASGPGVCISTISKLAMHRDVLGARTYDLLACDEAYQVPFADFATIADIADRALLVGDPGQLAPTVRVDTTRYEGAQFKVHRAVPRELHRRHPDASLFRLPASRRLVPDTVEIVQPSFYPDLPFSSSADPAVRSLKVSARGIGGKVDGAIDQLVAGASIVMILLPGAPPPFNEHDSEVADTMAAMVSRLLERQGEWLGQRVLGPLDIGVIDEHVNSGAAVRQRLRDRGLGAIKVDTPEVWQGLEVPITVVRHPLSVARSPGSFELDPGRFCVMLSRHLIGCVVVARASIEDVIREYSHDCGGTAWGAEDRAWSGYRAHSSVWEHLKRRNRLITT